jgi:ribonuclease P protein component
MERAASRDGLGIHRSRRLRRAREIQSLFERGNRRAMENFVALWCPAASSRRVGFAVGRRVGGAVARNRVRRRLREAYRYSQQRHPDATEIMFVGRALALTVPFRDLLVEMRRVLNAVSEVRAADAARGRQA